MKTKFTLLALFIAAFIGSATAQAWQVPNGGFNNWDAPNKPTSWMSYEAFFGNAPLGLTFRDSIDKVEGAASLKIVTDSIQAGATVRLVAGLASLGTGTYNPPAPFRLDGIPFGYRPDTLFFAYKYTSPGADSGVVALSLYSGGTASLGVFIPLDTTSLWIGGYLPLTGLYNNNNTIDSLSLIALSSIGKGVEGSELHIDDVSFGYVNLPTAINSIVSNVSVDIFPNPAKDVLNISVEGAEEVKAVEIFDITGKLVLAESVSSSNTKINTSDLANGSYVVRLLDENRKPLHTGKFNVAK
jgi:hypothetical protein